MITHSSASAFLAWVREKFSPATMARTLASTSICFDLSVYEIFAPLAMGGSVLIVPNLLSLAEAGGPDRVTLINTVPSAIAEL
jgi:non-ribosomal peptide synthetase component F